MLVNLSVKNIALIDDIEVEFSRGLNILTGETGAGKSIILGAVNLALGKKMSSDMIGKFGDYALVELVFTVESKKLQKELLGRDIICEDDQLILSRKVMAGKSICKINSETCTTSQMREVASLLLDIHGQHEHQKLLSGEQQLEILDEFAGDQVTRLKSEIAREYEQLVKLKEESSHYYIDEEARTRELSFLEFEINEITMAKLESEEDFLLEKTYRRLSNSKRIVEGLQSAYSLTGGEGSQTASDLISGAIKDVSGVKSYDEGLDNIYKMLLDIETMLGDYNHEVAAYLQNLTFSDEEFHDVEERLNLINRLKNKYGQSIADILGYQKTQMEKVEKLNNFAELKVKAQAKIKEQEDILETLCSELSIIRQNSAVDFKERLTTTLADLNFNTVDFEIVFKQVDRYTAKGQDQVEFLISTNLGEEPKSLAKVLSGGELSRIMLGIKTLIADKDDASTQIFDEIDAGISGRTAQKVAEKMDVIAKQRQVICITHLPQIAAMADAHYEIQKSVGDNKTTTQIFKLDNKGIIEELGRMLGGAQVTDSVRENAREMRALAINYKNK
jgi:DNA repair protein RecN